MYYCYLIKNNQYTYNGSTNDLKRRLRQHNGEISGGAKYTSSKEGKWEYYCVMSGFPDKVNALQCEWRWKHCNGKPGKRDKKHCGPCGRIVGLNEVLFDPMWTKQSTIWNHENEFHIYIKDEYRSLLNELPFYIQLHSLNELNI